MIRTLLSAVGALGILASCASQDPGAGRPSTSRPPTDHPHLGMWVTADGRIRQELLPNGRYEEERDGRKRAYTGRYTVTGDHIDYFDDLGFTATGDVRDGVLYHEHLVLYRESDLPR
ncbi:Atu4866 domain-containing protein [Actinomadura kijaniata]|uniref:Atu4866 domain-containing protein n=1 Tax=Actinomadura kijaniata TaxID=46161 RepID=UPI003F199FDF